MELTLEQYIEQYSENEPSLLANLNRQTHVKMLQPRMLSGHLQGRFLSMLSRMIRPQHILEIGTYTGYSALCMAEGLQKNGRIYSIEMNDELNDFAQSFINQSEYANNIELLVGNALDLIPTLHLTFDLVFIDGDKEQYEQYYNLSLQKLKPGGFMLIDNVLWSNKVLQPNASNDHATAAIKKFNKMIATDSQVSQVIIPIRDGITILQKKHN